jgi:hypothetical protein
VCVCILRYPACNAHAPYCHLWPDRLYNIFPYYLINGTIFEIKNKFTERKMCVLICAIILSQMFLFLRNIERDMIKMHISLRVPVIFVRFERNLNCLNRYSKKPQISNFIKKTFQWEPSYSIGRKGRWADMTNLIVFFLNFANAPKDYLGRKP